MQDSKNAQLPVEAVLSSLERNAGDHGGGEAANVELAVYSDLTDADLLSTRIEALITFGVDCVVIDSVLLSHDRLASLIDTLDQRGALIGQKALTCSTTPGPTTGRPAVSAPSRHARSGLPAAFRFERTSGRPRMLARCRDPLR